MITYEEVRKLSLRAQIAEAVILREFLQIVFLHIFYGQKGSENVIFKGGTCLRLIYGSERYSEDLDFTVNGSLDFLKKVFAQMADVFPGISFKIRKTLSMGKTFLLTYKGGISPYPLYMNLDFSFREKTGMPEKSLIDCRDYPFLFTNQVSHMSKEEILAEKIRALLTREKGRDLYDIWYLLSHNVSLDKILTAKKLDFYQENAFKLENLKKRIKEFPKEVFVSDLRPFVSRSRRANLPDFFCGIQKFLLTKASSFNDGVIFKKEPPTGPESLRGI